MMIPANMRAEKRWIVWRYSAEGKKLPHDPKNPGSKSIDATDENLWVDYDTAAAVVEKGGVDGLGFVLGDGWAGVDLDDVRDPATGVITPAAKVIVEQLDSYSEVSPSGTGIKIFIKAWLAKNHKRVGLEIYGYARYFTVTGLHITSTPEEPQSRSDELTALVQKEFGVDADTVATLPVDTDVIPDGSRNHTLYGSASLMRGRGFDDEAILQAMLIENDKKCTPPLSRREVEQIVRSSRRHKPNPPGNKEAVAVELNRSHFVIRVGKKTRKTVVGDDSQFPPSFETFESFRNFKLNDLRKSGADDEGNPTYQTSATIWLKHKDRRSYQGSLVFAPPDTCGYGDRPEVSASDFNVDHDYNLYRGFAIVPDPDPQPARRCSKFLTHVRDIVCSGNAEHTEFLLDLLAFKVQHPGRVSQVVPVLQGVQGSGKGLLVSYYMRLFDAAHRSHLDKPDHALGKFNALLSSKLIVFMDEAFWAGDKASIGAMKRLATEKTLIIEHKGIDPTEEPNFCQLFLATNEEWSWPSGIDERRPFILQVDKARRGDAAYFDHLLVEMNGVGPAALLAFLQQRTITHDLRQVPKTTGLGDNIDRTRDPVRDWWLLKLDRGHTWDEGDTWEPLITTKDAFDDFDSAYPRARMPFRLFLNAWREWLPNPSIKPSKSSVEVIDRKDRLESWRRGAEIIKHRRHVLPIPTLDVCRRAYTGRTGITREWVHDAEPMQQQLSLLPIEVTGQGLLAVDLPGGSLLEVARVGKRDDGRTEFVFREVLPPPGDVDIMRTDIEIGETH